MSSEADLNLDYDHPHALAEFAQMAVYIALMTYMYGVVGSVIFRMHFVMQLAAIIQLAKLSMILAGLFPSLLQIQALNASWDPEKQIHREIYPAAIVVLIFTNVTLAMLLSWLFQRKMCLDFGSLVIGPCVCPKCCLENEEKRPGGKKCKKKGGGLCSMPLSALFKKSKDSSSSSDSSGGPPCKKRKKKSRCSKPYEFFYGKPCDRPCSNPCSKNPSCTSCRKPCGKSICANCGTSRTRIFWFR